MTNLVGYIVGISEHVGNAMCSLVYNPVTKAILHRARCRPIPPDDSNYRAESVVGETLTSSNPRPVIKSLSTSNGEENNQSDTDDGEPNQDTPKPKLIFAGPEDFVGRSFLMDPQEDGQRFRAQVVKCLDDLDNELEQDKGRIRFLCKLNDDEKEELLTYNQIVDFLNRDAEQDTLWKYKKIVAHQGPLKPGHKDYMGSKYNIMLEWGDGQVTQEPLSIIAKDDPVTCAVYARENGLLEKERWRQFRGIAKRDKKFFRMVKQAMLRSYRSAPKFKCGVEIPQDYWQGDTLDINEP